jgi:biotin carboxyl carrier protein
MEVFSPLFGNLALLHVESGSVVEAGEAIGEIEAMKMYVRVSAPCAGTLTWLIELGEIVGEGDLIAEVS